MKKENNALDNIFKGVFSGFDSLKTAKQEEISYKSSSDFIINNIKQMFNDSKNIHIAPNIPESKLNNVSKAFKMEHRHIVALYDNTILGGADEGICFSGEKMVIKTEKDLFNIFYKDIESLESIPVDNFVTKPVIGLALGGIVSGVIGKGMEILSKDENTLLLVRKNGDEMFIKQGVRKDDEHYLVNFIQELLKVCNESHFKNENLLLPLEDMDEAIKKAYLKIIINMSYENDNQIDAKEQAEIFLLMSKIKLTQETRINVREYLLDINENKEDLKDLLKIIEEKSEPVQYKNIILSLVKDIINVYFSTQESPVLQRNCDFIKQNKQLLGVSQEQIDKIYEVVELDYKMLREEISDDKLKEIFKDMAAKGTAVGVPLAAVYLSGSVAGLGAAGITSGLAALGMGGVLGLSSMVTGIGVVVLLGVAAYQGAKWLASDDKLTKYQMRQLMLQDILKQTQKTISEIIDDINFLVKKLNELFEKNEENKGKIEKLSKILESFVQSAKCIENKNDEAQGYLIKLNLPKLLNVAKLQKLTNESTKEEFYAFILSCYEKRINQESNEEYVLKENLGKEKLETLAKILKTIGYKE
ncbi:hypothetical protein NCR96_06750 [Helicobacter sp. 14348-15]|uniref:hypothetical protein n=1 Tax=Helicobacter colisuis TaxID=2949739 RepID=UPI00202AFCD3|nr:hypothetical protein [Helicobacter colisuis]MCL9821431.1 hypothetical protein [Helicobacter colisuis]